MKKFLAAKLPFVLLIATSSVMAADCEWPEYIGELDMVALASVGEARIGNRTYRWEGADGTTPLNGIYAKRERVTDGVGMYILHTSQGEPFGAIALDCE